MIEDGDLTELSLEDTSSPPDFPAKGRRHRHGTLFLSSAASIAPKLLSIHNFIANILLLAYLVVEPSLEEADYFADYDTLVASRLEAIIIAKSGKKAQFANATELEVLLHPYAELHNEHNEHSEVALEPMWIDVQYPTEATMLMIARLFAVHPLTIEDCLIESEKAQQKFEIFEGYRFVSFAEHHAIPGTNVWSSIDVHMILPMDAPVLIVLHNGPVAYIAGLLNRIQSLSRVKNPLISGKGVRKRTIGECAFPSPEWLMYAILDQIVDQFLDLVYECSVEVERLEELVFVLPAREQSDFLRRIGAVRARIVVLRLQLLRKNDIVKNMISYASEQPVTIVQPVNVPLQTTKIRIVSKHNRRVKLTSGMKNVKVFMRDIQDHIVAMMVDLEQGKEELGAIATSFTSRISTQLSLADKEQNKLLQLFNALATIVLPLTFVTVLFGMNCPVPWQGSAVHNLRPYGGILGTLLGSGFVASLLFWWLDWF